MNGEAITGTRPWKNFGEGPTAVAEGSFNDTKRKDFTAQDIRFTSKGSVLYAVIIAWPGAEISIKAFADQKTALISRTIPRASINP